MGVTTSLFFYQQKALFFHFYPPFTVTFLHRTTGILNKTVTPNTLA